MRGGGLSREQRAELFEVLQQLICAQPVAVDRALDSAGTWFFKWSSMPKLPTHSRRGSTASAPSSLIASVAAYVSGRHAHSGRHEQRLEQRRPEAAHPPNVECEGGARAASATLDSGGDGPAGGASPLSPFPAGPVRTRGRRSLGLLEDEICACEGGEAAAEHDGCDDAARVLEGAEAGQGVRKVEVGSSQVWTLPGAAGGDEEPAERELHSA